MVDSIDNKVKRHCSSKENTYEERIVVHFLRDDLGTIRKSISIFREQGKIHQWMCSS